MKYKLESGRELMAHQEDGVDYALEPGRNHPAFLMQMRLGKTLTAITWIKELEARGEPTDNILIVAPPQVLRAWRLELIAEDEHYVLVAGLDANKRKDQVLFSFNCPHRTWLLVNYEALRVSKYILGLPFNAVMLDESTRAKNPSAKVTQLLCKSFRDCSHRAILTGMPDPEGELDLFCQYQFLHGQFMGFSNYWAFRNALFVQQPRGGWTPKFGTSMKIKAMLHRKSFIRRRDELNIGSRKIYSTRYVGMNDEQAVANEQAKKDFTYVDKHGVTQETEYAIVKATWMSRIAGGFSPDKELISSEKLREIKALLHNDLKGEQVVIWCRFNSEIEHLYTELSKEYLVARIIGDDNTEVREKRRLDFNAKRVQILIAQIACARYGIDCSGADTAIYYSNSYSAEMRNQSEDRIVHPKKERPLLYIDLITEGSIDEAVVPLLQNKTFRSDMFMSVIRDWAKQNATTVQERITGLKS